MLVKYQIKVTGINEVIYAFLVQKGDWINFEHRYNLWSISGQLFTTNVIVTVMLMLLSFILILYSMWRPGAFHMFFMCAEFLVVGCSICFGVGDVTSLMTW